MDTLGLITELRHSLKHKRVLEVASVAIVEVDCEILILKNRFPEYIMHNYNHFVHVGYQYPMDYDFNEYLRKKVNIDLELFGKRGQDAIEMWRKGKESSLRLKDMTLDKIKE